MARPVVHPDKTLELLPDRPRGRQPKLLELAGYYVFAMAVSGAGLVALPFVITVLGAIAPVAVVALFLRWAWRARR